MYSLKLCSLIPLMTQLIEVRLYKVSRVLPISHQCIICLCPLYMYDVRLTRTKMQIMDFQCEIKSILNANREGSNQSVGCCTCHEMR